MHLSLSLSLSLFLSEINIHISLGEDKKKVTGRKKSYLAKHKIYILLFWSLCLLFLCSPHSVVSQIFPYPLRNPVQTPLPPCLLRTCEFNTHHVVWLYAVLLCCSVQPFPAPPLPPPATQPPGQNGQLLIIPRPCNNSHLHAKGTFVTRILGWGDYADHRGSPNLTTRVLKSREGSRRAREDATTEQGQRTCGCWLLSLKVEQPTTGEFRQPLETGKSKETDSP